MARRLIKSALAHGARLGGVDRALRRLRYGWRRPLVLGYHRVVNDVDDRAEVGDGTIPAMLVSTRTLERQLDWVGQHYDFADLDEVARQAVAPVRRRRPLAAVTFDDGYADVYHNALPLLRRKGIPFAVFVVTALAGTHEYQLHDKLYRLLQARGDRDPLAATRALLTTRSRRQLLKRVAALERRHPQPRRAPAPLRAMDWDMVRALDRAGVTVGSHTHNHPFLTNEPRHTLTRELAAASRTLRRELGYGPRHFAYPNGDFDHAVAASVAATGHEFAFTTCGCRAGLPAALTIPRRLLWERSGSDADGRFSPALFSCEMAGLFDAVSGCRRGHGSS